MANTTIDSTAYSGGIFPVYGPFWFDDQIAVVVAINSGNDPTRYHTTNGGSTWSESAISSSTTGGLYAWFDRNTIGYTPTNGLLAASGGSLVHIVYGDSLGTAFSYVAVNSSGTIGTPVNIVSGSFNSAPTQNVNCFVVRTRNGNLIAGYRDFTNGANAVYRSTDGGGTWSSRTTCYEGNSDDQAIALQCNTGDDADAAIAYWDWSADEISIKVYDDSANTWTETSISGSMAENVAYIPNMDASVMADGKCFLAAFSEMDSATADLKTWLLNIDSVSSPTVTAKTDVLTNTDDAFYPSVSVDRRSGDIYVGYLTGSSATTTNPFYKKSSDTGSTWGSAVAFSDASEGSYTSMHMGNGVSANGGRIVPAWRDGTNNDILTSLVADVVITSDVQVESSASPNIDSYFTIGIFHGPYWTSDQVGAIVYLNSAADVVARKTTDGGQTWGSAVAAEAGTAGNGACWFDQETPTDSSGTKIHTAWCDTAAQDLSYAAFDISAGTWSTPVDINAALGVGQPGRGISIQKTRSGNLIVTSAVNGTTALAYKSSDGSSWTSIATPYEGSFVDLTLSASVNTGDGNDGAVIFQDTSADQISVKMYDDSADTWTETTIATLVETDSSYMARAIRRSDGHTILAFWNATDSAAADLELWDLNLNSIASPTCTAKTSVNTNLSEAGDCSVFINQSNDEIYVSYNVGTAYTATVSVFYKKSSDGGSTWGSQQTYSYQIEDDFRIIAPSAMSASNGGRFEVAWCDDDDDDIFVNYNNSVSIAAASSFDPATGFAPQQPFPSIPDWRRVPAIAY